MKVRMLSMLVACAIALPAHAQVERSGNVDARVMQQIQALTSERASLQAENAKLEQELQQLKKDLQKSGSERAAAENRAKALAANASRGEATSKQAEEQLERTRAQMQELVAKFRETANTLRDVETDRATVKSQLGAKERELNTCIDRNAALYNLNAEVLDRMESRGFWSSVTEREPFTKLKRVELENLIDGYKYRADELRLEAQKQAEKQAQARE
jgi:Skp family chaperone for outer membrane proteins